MVIIPTPVTATKQHTFSLSLMMFLQYAVWGVWLPYLANYLMAKTHQGGLGFTGAQVGWILGLAASIGAVSAPFLAGQIADRFINAEKYLALLLISGGIVKFVTASVHDYHTFIVLSILYSVLYMPTLALTNSIAFAHLNDPEKQFPFIRVWGTIGWIVASNAFPLLWLQSNLHVTRLPPFIGGTDKPNATALWADCLRVAGVLAIAYGIWAAFALPATPPLKTRQNRLAFAKAFALLKHRGFLVVTLVSLPIAMIHQVYFIRTGPFIESLGFAKAHVGPILSIGQISEIFFLAILGFLLSKLGYKLTLALGCLAYAIRFALFAITTPDIKWLMPAATILHGLCYGCFFAGAFIYVERIATPDIRHSAQTVFGIIILGIGPVLAGGYNQWLDHLQLATPLGPIFDYRTFWFIQSAIAAGSMLALLALFRPGLNNSARSRNGDRIFENAVARTSCWIASARAIESERADALFHDPLATALAGNCDPNRQATLPFLAIRTRFFDDNLFAAVTDRALTQVVLVGAGMDTRAFRFDWNPQLKWFEVDQSEVLRYKQGILDSQCAKPRCERIPVPTDLARDWKTALIQAGFEPDRPTAFLVEGLLIYLQHQAVDTLLTTLTRIAAPGSWLGTDMVSADFLRDPDRQSQLASLKRDGCPWLFGVNDPADFIEKFGWNTTYTRPGEPTADFGRWPYPVPPRDAPGVPQRSFLIVASR